MACPNVEDFYGGLCLGTAKDIVAAANGSEVAVVKGNNS